MKHLLITVLAVLFIGQAYGQSDRVTSAWNNLKYNELEKALNNLKKASKHEDTKDEAKTWLYLGHTYYSLDTSQKDAFKDLVMAPKNKAVEAYAKAQKLDESGRYTSKIQGNAVRLGVNLFNAGAQDYNKALKSKKKKDTAAFKKYFKRSLKHFESHFATRKLAGKYASYINQTLTQNNIDPKKTLLYAGYSAYQIGQFDKALNYLGQLVKQDSKKPDAYLFMSNVYLDKGDTTKALAIIDSGRRNVENSKPLQNRMLRIYQQTGQVNKLTTNLKKSIAKDSSNLQLYRVLASTYEKLSKQSRESGNPDRAKKYKDSARRTYNSILEVDPGNYKANYNLGIMYYNIGVDKVKRSQEVDDIDKLTRLENEASEEFKKAIPYLEKSFHKNCDDKNLYRSLKNVYKRTGKSSKAKALKSAHADANQVVVNIKGKTNQMGTVTITHSGKTSKYKNAKLSDRKGDYIGWETNICPKEGDIEVNLEVKEGDTPKVEIYQEGSLKKEVEGATSFTYMP
jgi:Tfp pilus assembly protein PilF